MVPQTPRTPEERLLALELTLAHVHDLIEDMHARLFGNHQPGELEKLKQRVGRLERYRAKAVGFIAACGTIGAGAGALAAVLVQWFRR